jgi:hypothetical protein
VQTSELPLQLRRSGDGHGALTSSLWKLIVLAGKSPTALEFRPWQGNSGPHRSYRATVRKPILYDWHCLLSFPHPELFPILSYAEATCRLLLRSKSPH